MTSPTPDDSFIPNDSFMEGYNALMTRLRHEREILRELERRCWLLLSGRPIVEVDDITISAVTSCIAAVLVSHDGDVTCVYNSAGDCSPDFEVIEQKVLPILRKHMVLDDLGRI